MSLKSAAEEYFSNLNSIAARLHSDLEETKSTYEDLWVKLSEKEQQAILSESIIKPEVSIKYDSREQNPETDYAVKLIFDDNCSYRDEHSGPFSFRTKSQRDLRFQTEKPNNACGNKAKGPKQKPKPKPPPMLHQDSFSNSDAINIEILTDSKNTLPKTGLDFLDNW